jgi:two-component sensor histidine kinase
MQVESVGGRQVALQSMRDITDRKLSEERQRMLLSDQTHRLKNTLAVVQSIAHQSAPTHTLSLRTSFRALMAAWRPERAHTLC